MYRHDSYYENLSDLPVDDFQLGWILKMTHTAKYQQLVGFGGRKDFHFSADLTQNDSYFKESTVGRLRTVVAAQMFIRSC